MKTTKANIIWQNGNVVLSERTNGRYNISYPLNVIEEKPLSADEINSRES